MNDFKGLAKEVEQELLRNKSNFGAEEYFFDGEEKAEKIKKMKKYEVEEIKPCIMYKVTRKKKAVKKREEK